MLDTDIPHRSLKNKLQATNVDRQTIITKSSTLDVAAFLDPRTCKRKNHKMCHLRLQDELDKKGTQGKRMLIL